MGYVSKYKGADIDEAIKFVKDNADIGDKLSEKAERLHAHKLSDITNLEDLTVSWDSITGKPETFPGSGSENNSVSWADITGKPNTFTPSSHTHKESEIEDLKEPSWDDITGKPSTFIPTKHTHEVSDLTDTDKLKVEWSNILNKPIID